MKTRIISAAIGIPVLFLLTLVASKMIAAVVFGFLLAIGVYELLYRTGLVTHMRLVIYSAVAAFLLSIWSIFDAVHAYLALGLIVFFVLTFAEVMIDHVKVSVEMVALCFLGGFVVPYMLSALIRILAMGNGRYFIMLPFTIAFLSDGGAYFVGLKFGKHKLAPVVSPHKTIEGLLGGVAASLLGAIIYALILRFALSMRVNFGYALIYGLAGALVGVVGDLCFSVIKRQTGIKDYGNLLPGHGGFLDRFDSLVLIAPFIESLLIILPMAV